MLSSARTVGSEVRVQVTLTPPPAGRLKCISTSARHVTHPAPEKARRRSACGLLGASSNAVGRVRDGLPRQLVPAGSVLTATVTDSGNNTSEFSFCEQVDRDRRHGQSVDYDDRLARSGGRRIAADLQHQRQQPRSDAASNVVVTDGFHRTSRLCPRTPIGSLQRTRPTVTCTIGLASRAALRYGHRIVVTPTAAATLTNTATVSAKRHRSGLGKQLAATSTTVVNAARRRLVVTNTNDSGAGSLRQAILDANAHAGPDLNHFNIPGAGVRQIFAVNLPAITDPVTIDGTSQPGWSSTDPSSC